ncbi:hypothetical protein [Pedobacter aquatilis]|uniref:hypothetical protein n=1 Tax=Pedobacter aquatilis TaxID=351343 RepID=UPI0029302D21|nr:hypothetical protein [Pedobacter aquatilis]
MKASGIEIEVKIAEGFTSKLSNRIFFADTQADTVHSKIDAISTDYLLRCRHNLKNAISLASAMVL